MLDNLILGFNYCFSASSLLYILIGSTIGTIIGVLPGIGPLTTITILLPITFTMPAAQAIMMLGAIYYGAQYGGSTSAILMKIPGELSSMVTCIDGYKLSEKGESGKALFVAAFGSFLAGVFATVLIGLISKPITDLSLMFTSMSYVSFIFVGLIVSTLIIDQPISKSLIALIFGILMSTIGIDSNDGTQRFVFGVSTLFDGIGIVVLVTGMFGLVEVIKYLKPDYAKIYPVGSFRLDKSEYKRIMPSIGRGTLLGSVIGMIPGGGALISSILAYSTEKFINPKVGTGVLEGVAAPEAANNAGAQTSFIPMLTLGIPENPVVAVMLAALMIHGVQIGPTLLTTHSELFWGFVVSMLVGNAMLLILNLPLIKIWINLVSVDTKYVYTASLLFSIIGALSLSSDISDVMLIQLFFVIGFLFHLAKIDVTPAMMGFALGPLLEEKIFQSVVITHGSWGKFFADVPATLFLVVLAIVIIVKSRVFKRAIHV